MVELQRTQIKDVFTKANGEKVLLKGWVYDSRDLKKVRFIVLRDMTGRVQVTAVSKETDEATFNMMDKISRESVVEVVGIIKDCKQAPGGKEIAPEKITVLAQAENPLPIDVTDYSKTELPIRLDYRFLDLHREKIQSIFRVQSTILQAYREFMINEEKAIEALFPSIIGSSSEGGTELFKAKYFEKEVCLSQSCQLYKQMLACSMEKVFAVFTVWRAEKHNTLRHLNESRQMDYEEAFADDKKVMDVLGRCVQYIVKVVMERNKKELDLLEVKLVVPEIKYLTFAEVKTMLKGKAHVGEDDLNGESETALGEMFPDTIIFVHDWPLSGKPFYIWPKDGDPKAKLSNGFDAIYKGMEISSGGQRVHLPELLIERLKVKGLNPADFKSYIDSFRYGAPPHAGWGMGVERLTMLILGLKNIREAVLFPRDRDRLTP
ncbi:aspartate--tRNA(Asn) ligase [Candidatus Pacearchaeota archaeon]|nr:aspartate--tRNA(Asn) ligase [Candidatus Pacearchaeota archaeon]